MMTMRKTVLALLLASSATNAFAPVSFGQQQQTLSLSASALGGDIEKTIKESIKYSPGQSDGALAKRFGHLAGAEIRTVGEAFADFTKQFGQTVNPLYKNMVTDLVGTTHLITVNARFVRDPLWCLGIMTALELLLKNYPEADLREEILEAFFSSVKMDLAEVRAEAATMSDWAAGKTKEQIEAALSGDDDSKLAEISKLAKSDELWMYSRYFGIGLVKLMEMTGVEMDKDEVYPIMEDWMSNKLGRTHLTACGDSDLFFRVKDKLDMMETMMKEIEIREKKRMAERLEEKAELALAAAEREKEWQKEVVKEKEPEEA